MIPGSLRFIPGNGKLVLQVYEERRLPEGFKTDWYDVKGQEYEDEILKYANEQINHIMKQKAKAPKEFFLVDGRYFETWDQANMWALTKTAPTPYNEIRIMHVREVRENQSL